MSSYNQLSIQVEALPQKISVPESKARYCANVNIMPASVYKLIFHDPDLQKLAPSKLEIGTYTTNTVKLVGPCTFYLVHPDTKGLQEVTSYVASNNESVLFSCATMLILET